MSRKMNLLATALVLAATSFTAHTASAFSLVAVGETIATVAMSARTCPPGEHLGYEGKYCWRNREAASPCPPGEHLGYEGKYCWRNH